MNKNIAIIGCGNLGRRHLQAVMKCKCALNIYVYDINPDVFELAKQIVNNDQISNDNSVNYITSLEQLPKEIFVVVVASSASGRAETVKNLIKRCDISYMILEKVLFQKMDDYDEIENLFMEKNIVSFVNCPRRYYELYRKLKKSLENIEFKAYVSGKDWGLGCNFIHMLDMLAYLGGTNNLKIDISELDDKIIESKRVGYKEISGTIKGNIGLCKEFSVSSYLDKEQEFTIYIESNNERILILESQKICYLIGESTNWRMEKVAFEIPYQSALTNLYVESLINNKTCDLTTYRESSVLHKSFIEPLTEYFRERGEKNNLCPIT